VSARARHRAVLDRPRWRRSSVRAVVLTQRRVGIDVVNTLTKVAHLVAQMSWWPVTSVGEYVAFCGARFLAASVVEPGLGRCVEYVP
jgi:hypothetical protein